MIIQNKPQINFKASISEQVRYQLYRQLSTSSTKLKSAKLLETQLEKQIKNISQWGSSDSEIVIVKDYRGRYGLGLQYNVTSTMKFACPIKLHLGKTELS